MTIRKFLLCSIIALCWNGSFCYAQDQKILDSLRKEIISAKNDTVKIKTYINIGILYFENSVYDSAINNFRKAEKISELNSGKYPFVKTYRTKSIRFIGIVHYNQGTFDKAIEFFDQSYSILNDMLISAKAENNKEQIWKCRKEISIILNDIGNVHRDQGTYDKALDYFLKSLKITEELLEVAKQTNDKEKTQDQKKSLSKSLIGIGTVHYFQNNFDKAINYYTRALKIFDELISTALKNGDTVTANKFKQGLSACYNNIGMVNSDKGNLCKQNKSLHDSLFNSALDFYKKSLSINEELGDKKGLSKCYNNFGSIYKELQKYDLALEYYNKSLKLKEEAGDKNGLATVWGNLADLHINIADSVCRTKAEKNIHYNTAINYGLKSLDLAIEIDSKYIQNASSSQLLKAYKAIGNVVLALKYAEIFIDTKDSLFNEEKTQSLTEMETKYESEKKQLEIEKLEKQKALDKETIARKEAESKKQRTIIYSFVAGFLIILIFSIIVFRLFIAKRRANQLILVKNLALEQANEEISSQRDEIEAQRDLVITQKNHIEEIHEEVTSSIRYAKRIQGAVLPAKEQLDEILGEHFVMFKPRNIVSGDFYWITKIKKWMIFCVADCTGHGVPGAFMSMLGISFLNEIVRKEEVTNAADVLNHLRESVIHSLKQKGINIKTAPIQSGVIDGMDIAFCALDTETLQLQFAGANNPMYIVTGQQSTVTNQQSAFSEKSTVDYRLFELKADKMPIATYPKMDKFKNNEIQLSKGDTLYLFSDGFADQFGGPDGKKFMYKPFKELLLNISQKPLEEQSTILHKTIMEWIGTGVQIDDITVMGIKI